MKQQSMLKKNSLRSVNTYKLIKSISVNRQLLFMLVPGIAYYIIFRYIPMYGIIVAFKDFSFMKGIGGSDWIGLEHFIYMFNSKSFPMAFTNTLVLGVLKLIFSFPIPILFAIFLNEVKNVKFKKLVQTTSYLPHFLSWVILGGIFFQIFSVDGPINVIFQFVGIEKVPFLINPQWFRVVLVSTHVWKIMGWNSIVYLAAITSISPDLYESAMIDGANRIKRMIYITLPSLAPVVTVMFILSVGRIINDGFDQVFNLYNSAVYSTADVISTYVYRQGLEQMEYSYAAAVDLFKNVIALILVYGSNRISKRVNDYGIW